MKVFITVTKEWYDSSMISPLVKKETNNLHIIYSEFDRIDEYGIWAKNVISNLTNIDDGCIITWKSFLIPKNVILGAGFVDDTIESFGFSFPSLKQAFGSVKTY